MPHVTFVKKILANGDLCQKCFEVSDRLDKDGTLDLINYIAIAEENNPDSEGMQLAEKYQVARAPFFVVEEEDGSVQAFDIYFKFKRYMQKSGYLVQSADVAELRKTG